MGSKNTSQSHASYLEDSTRFVFLPELGFVQKEFNALQQLALFCHNHLENPRHIFFRFDHAVSVCLTLGIWQKI